jgi:SAM-dependent methyltransferase
MYEVLSRVYDKALGDHYHPVILGELERALEEHGGSIDRSVLDLGCGTGTLACELAGRGWRVTGVDASPAMLERARAKAAERGVDVEILEGDIRKFRAGGNYGLAVCFYDTLNHLMTNSDLLRALRSIHASLGDDGLLAFDVSNRVAFYSLWEDPEPFEHEEDGSILRIHTRFDRANRTGEAQVEIECDGRGEKETIRQRYYSDTEIRGLLQAESFEVLECHDFAAFPDQEVKAGEGAVWKDHPDADKGKTFWLARRAG